MAHSYASIQTVISAHDSTGSPHVVDNAGVPLTRGRRRSSRPSTSSGARKDLTLDAAPILLHIDQEGSALPEAIEEIHGPVDLAKTESRDPSRPAPIAIARSPVASRNHSRGGERREPSLEPPLPTLTGRARRKKKRALKKAANDPAGLDCSGVVSNTESSEAELSPAVFQRRDLSLSSSVSSSPAVRPVSHIGGISALRRQLSNLDVTAAVENPLSRGVSMERSSTTDSLAIHGHQGVNTPSDGRGASCVSMERSTTSDSLAANSRGVSMHRTTTSDSFATSASGTSETDVTETTSYEVPLNIDFTSKQAEEDTTSDPQSPRSVPGYLRHKMTALDFDPLMCLGKGTFGTVYLVREQATGRLFAQKVFKKASLTVRHALVEQTKTERHILEAINQHPFIVTLYYAFQDHAKLYLLLQYASGGELFTYLADAGRFEEPVAAFYMAELVLALNHLHRTVGVIYRDLKPENCLLDASGHLLLADFGLSKVAVDDEACTSTLGTIEYMAPEVVRGRPYGASVDWWSLGALGVDLLTGTPPFGSGAHVGKRITAKQPVQLPRYVGPDARDLLQRLLKKEPGKRLGAHMPKDLQTIQTHRFFRKIDWDQLACRACTPPIVPKVTDPARAENFAPEFTGLPLSPVEAGSVNGWRGGASNPFGGFSYIASRTVLDDSMVLSHDE